MGMQGRPHGPTHVAPTSHLPRGTVDDVQDAIARHQAGAGT